MHKFLDILNVILKLLICPFFFLLSYLALTTVYAYLTGSFEKNSYETLEGIVVGIFIIAPVAFLILASISLIIFRVFRKIHALNSEKFLVVWGAVMAVITFTTLFFFAGILEIFYLVF